MKSVSSRLGMAPWASCQLWPLLLVTVLCCAGALEPEDTWDMGSGHMSEEVNVLESLTLHSANLVNVSFGAEDSCLSLDMGQYSTLSVSTRAAFGESFADQLSLLVMLRSSLKEDTSLLSILNLHGDITFQIRINPSAFIFFSNRRGLYEFPLPSLTDGKWHRVALAISAKGVSLYVDCKRVETLPWSNYFGLEVSTDGIVMLGGVIDQFDVPFNGSLQKLVFVMGDPGAAKRFCVDYNQTCLSSFPAEPLLNLSRSERGRRLDPASKVLPMNESWKDLELGGENEQLVKQGTQKYISELDLSQLKEEDLIPAFHQDPLLGPGDKTSKKDDHYKKTDVIDENITTEKKRKPVSSEHTPTDKSLGSTIDLTNDLSLPKPSPPPAPTINASFSPTDVLPTMPTDEENQTSTISMPPSYSETATKVGSGPTMESQDNKYPPTVKPQKTPVQGPPGPHGHPGCRGRPGFPGPKGDKGYPGVMGRVGVTGNPGPRGPPGLPIIMIWGNSQEDWAAFYHTSVYQLLHAGWPRGRGPVGLPGISGKPGAPGQSGNPGNTGDKGQRGPMGLQGPTGLPGIPGVPGKDGSNGLDGKVGSSGLLGGKGLQGFRGDPGSLGEKGDEGFIGSPGPNGEEGAEGIKGLKGEPGPPGTAGAQGPKGLKGEAGSHGPPGLIGEMGVPGIRGPPGPEGEQGQPGFPGAQGVNGSQGDVGPRGIPGHRGPQGPPGLEGICGPPGRRGPQGMNGPEGPPGQKGEMGEPGVLGLRGDRGQPGHMGLIGWPGIDGPPGEKGHCPAEGEKGDPGIKGEKGFPGPMSARGPPGDQGPTGFVGFQGPKGNLGPRGAEGEDGQVGPLGSNGSDGAKGNRGPDGPKGLIGTRGNRGRMGQRGLVGIPGTPGQRGVQGPQGAEGLPGTGKFTRGAWGERTHGSSRTSRGHRHGRLPWATWPPREARDGRSTGAPRRKGFHW